MVETNKTNNEENEKVEQTPDDEKTVDGKLTTTETKIDSENLKKDVVPPVEEKNVEQEKKDKEEMENLLKEDNVKSLKTVEDVQKATDKYWKIMDTYWVDTVAWWVPWWDVASGIFSTLFFIYQWSKLPEWKNLPWYKRAEIFGLQLVDSVGKPVWKTLSAVYLAAQWAILWLALWPIWAAVWWIWWWIWWYLLWWTLFDYFFKANKRSADIFNKHCEKIKFEAKKQWMKPEEIAKFEKDHSTLRNLFDKTKKWVDQVKKWVDKTKDMYNKWKKNYQKYNELNESKEKAA